MAMTDVEILSFVVLYRLQVLFSTETFAMGVNAPARTVRNILQLLMPTYFSELMCLSTKHFEFIVTSFITNLVDHYVLCTIASLCDFQD